MRIAVLGDSHAGSLKRAWDAMSQEYDRVSLTFFAQRRYGLQHLEIENKKLICRNETHAKALAFTSGGLTVIDPAKYDIFLLYGLGARPFFLEPSDFSQRAIDVAVVDVSQKSLSYRTVKKVRAICKHPIFLGHTPLRPAKTLRTDDDTSSYIAGMKLLNESVYAPLNCQMMTQPIETICCGNRTRPEFSVGSKRLAVGDSLDDELHGVSDEMHMNDEFGKIWLRQFIARI